MNEFKNIKIFSASQENCDTNGEVLPETTSWKPSQKIEITLSTILASVQQQEAQIRVGLYHTAFI